VVIAVSVGLTHLTIIGALNRFAGRQGGIDSDSPPLELISVAIPTPKPAATGHVPVPAVHLSSPVLEVPTLTEVTFEDPDADILGATSAPQPLLPPVAETARHAVRAGLLAGESVTVVLSVEVLPDGSVGLVSLQSPSGNPSADLEAMAFARTVRWIPGTLGRHAVSMRVQYAVTLTAPT
jgi:TonB family protein